MLTRPREATSWPRGSCTTSTTCPSTSTSSPAAWGRPTPSSHIIMITLNIWHCIRTTQGGGGPERAHHLGGAGAGLHGPHLASPVQQDLHRLRGRREGRAHGQRQLAVQEQVESAEDDRQAGGQGLRQVELRPGIWPGCQKILEQRK